MKVRPVAGGVIFHTLGIPQQAALHTACKGGGLHTACKGGGHPTSAVVQLTRCESGMLQVQQIQFRPNRPGVQVYLHLPASLVVK